MEIIFCQYCGTQNAGDARFCKKCGGQITAPTPHPSNPQQPVFPQYPQQPVAPQYPQQPVAPQYPQQPVIPQYPQSVPVVTPQYASQIPVQPIAPPVKKKKKTSLILIGILLGLFLCCGGWFGYNQLFITPIQKTADAFMNALQNQDYTTAFNFTNADVQTQLGNVEGLKNYSVSTGLIFNSWKQTSTRRVNGNPPQGVVIGELTFADGTIQKFEVDLVVGPNSIWQVMGFGSPSQ
jgi:hypothetical protein